jgi:hypothetical protein
MKLNFLKLKTRSFLKSNKALRSSLPYKQAMTVGILFTVEDRLKHDAVKDLVRKLEHDGKQVKVMTFLPNHKENFEFLFDFFTEKDVSFWGNITSDSATRFAEAPFDFLFYLDMEPNPHLLNIVARSKAKCRVGRHFEKSDAYFEFMIESKNGLKDLMDGMYKYTSKLR